jgi:hypothetical protein
MINNSKKVAIISGYKAHSSNRLSIIGNDKKIIDESKANQVLLNIFFDIRNIKAIIPIRNGYVSNRKPSDFRFPTIK